MKHPQVSVVIPVHDRVEQTRRCLYKWMRQVEAPPYELILVDDGSTENIPQMLESIPVPDRGPEIVYERLEHELLIRSPTTAYNRGFRLARGNYIVLSSQDVIVPELALVGLLATSRRCKPRRAAMIVRWLSEQMYAQLDKYSWQDGLQAVSCIPGFWTDENPYNIPNCRIDMGGLFILCTGMEREDWEWIGFLRELPYYGTDDRDLVVRERFLSREAVTVPDLWCVHQFHTKLVGVRSRMIHPGFVYENEAQARLREEAKPAGQMTPVEELKKLEERATQQSNLPDMQFSAAPDHVTLHFAHVLSIISRLGVKRIAVASDYYTRDFVRLAEEKGYQAGVLGHLDNPGIAVSLMAMQKCKTHPQALEEMANLRALCGKLVVMVPYKEHFHTGDNILCFDEETMGAPWNDTTLTGYLVGVW